MAYELAMQRRVSYILDFLIYILVFLVAYILFRSMLPFHFVEGIDNIQEKVYNFVTPVAASIFILLLLRIFSVLLLNSSIGLKLNRFEYYKKDLRKIEILKYDLGLYLFLVSLIVISLFFNFSTRCCYEDLSINETIASIILFAVLLGSFVLWPILIFKRGEKIQVILNK